MAKFEYIVKVTHRVWAANDVEAVEMSMVSDPLKATYSVERLPGKWWKLETRQERKDNNPILNSLKGHIAYWAILPMIFVIGTISYEISWLSRHFGTHNQVVAIWFYALYLLILRIIYKGILNSKK